MTPDATADELRAAYRRLVRTHHPDARGGAGATEMAAINEAWRVLSDPARRAVYDAGLRRGEAGPAGEPVTPVATAPRPDLTARFADPPRFPWRFVVFASLFGAIVVIALAALVDPPTPAPPDNLLEGGSCVVIEPNGDAAEAPCTGPYDGVVEVLVPFDGTCPYGTEPHRDRQGLGIACVRSGERYGSPRWAGRLLLPLLRSCRRPRPGRHRPRPGIQAPTDTAATGPSGLAARTASPSRPWCSGSWASPCTSSPCPPCWR